MPTLPVTPERKAILRIVLQFVAAERLGGNSAQGRAVGLLTVALGLAARYPNDALRLYDQLRTDLDQLTDGGPALQEVIDEVHGWLNNG